MRCCCLWLLAAGAFLGASACANTSTSTSPSAPAITFTGSVAPYGTSSQTIEAATAGTLTLTLTWNGNVDLDLYLTDDLCSGYPPDACSILTRSTASSGNHEEVTWPVKKQQRFKVWADNFSPNAGADYTVVAVIR